MKNLVAPWGLGISLLLTSSLLGCRHLTQQDLPNTAPQSTTSETNSGASSPGNSAKSNPPEQAKGTAQKSTNPSSSSVSASAKSTTAQTAATLQDFATSRPPITVEKLQNAEYYFLAKGPIKLVNGKYEDPETKRTYEMSDVVTYGDIDKDGVKDGVTALKVTIPNTGNFSYLVAVVNELGSPKNISTEFLGPQIKVKSLTIKPDNSIEAVMGQYQAGDPACCPRIEITRTYKLRITQSPETPAATPPK